MYNVEGRKPRPYLVKVKFCHKLVSMEIDTGAPTSLVGMQTYRKLFPHLTLRRPSVRLITCTGEEIPVAGELRGQVEYEGQKEVKLVVMKKNGPSLLGRDWLEKIQLNWKRIAINHVSRNTEKELGDLLSKCGDIFGEELGRMEHFKAKLSVKADATPKFYKPRPVPLALREAVGQELDRLESRGILQKIPYSEWAAPIVVVPKPGGKLRLCGDYKVTVNQALEPDKYPLPKPEDLFTVLTGGDKFSKLDLREAYMQMELEVNMLQSTPTKGYISLQEFRMVFPLHQPCSRRQWILSSKARKKSYLYR